MLLQNISLGPFRHVWAVLRLKDPNLLVLRADGDLRSVCVPSEALNSRENSIATIFIHV